MAALAGLADTVQDIAVGYGKAKREEEAVEEAYADIAEAASTGKPLKKRNVIKFGAPAYNQVIDNSYLASVETEAITGISAIAADYPSNTAEFQRRAEQFTQGILKGVQPEYIGRVGAGMQNIIAASYRDIQKKEVERTVKEADDQIVTGIETNLREAGNAFSRFDFASGEQLVESAILKIENRYASGAITLRQAETAKRNISVEAQSQQASAQLQYLYDKDPEPGKPETGGAIAAARFIQQLTGAQIKDFSAEEVSKLQDDLRARLNAQISLDKIEEDKDDEQRKNSQQSTAVGALSSILSGDANESDLTRLAKGNQISFNQYSSLTSTLTNRGRGVDDYGLMAEIKKVMRTDPEEAIDMISENAESRLTGETASSLLNDALDRKSGESILKNNKVVRFRRHVEAAYDGEKNAFGQLINAGEQERLSKAMLVFDERVLEAQDPDASARIASELIPLAPVIKDFDDQIKALDTDLINGVIDDAEYNQRYQKLHHENKLFSNYLEFTQFYQNILKGEE